MKIEKRMAIDDVLATLKDENAALSDDELDLVSGGVETLAQDACHP